MQIKKTGVVGAGTMGHGIAQALATSGFEVKLYELHDECLKVGLAKIESALGMMAAKGKITEGAKSEILSRIEGTDKIESLAGSDFVVEAATESPGIKAEIFKKLDELCRKEVVLASNTSTISITRIAAATRRPDRVIGMHFFNPAPVMKLIEITRGLATSDETFQIAHEIALKVGKTPVAVNDSAGFVANRVLMPMINEAIFALYEGVATAKAIDDVMKLGMNHPMGPLELADLIGLDVCLAIIEELYRGFNDSKYRPCPLLKKMVDAGYLGRKSGRGFYEYPSK